MRVLCAAVMIAALSGPAFGQFPGDRKEADKPKTTQEIQAEKAAEKAYQNSLQNIPDRAATDPWGNVRSDGAPKPAAKAAAAKRTKTGSSAN
jgi:hypothetical protein